MYTKRFDPGDLVRGIKSVEEAEVLIRDAAPMQVPLLAHALADSRHVEDGRYTTELIMQPNFTALVLMLLIRASSKRDLDEILKLAVPQASGPGIFPTWIPDLYKFVNEYRATAVLMLLQTAMDDPRHLADLAQLITPRLPSRFPDARYGGAIEVIKAAGKKLSDPKLKKHIDAAIQEHQDIMNGKHLRS